MQRFSVAVEVAIMARVAEADTRETTSTLPVMLSATAKQPTTPKATSNKRSPKHPAKTSKKY